MELHAAAGKVSTPKLPWMVHCPFPAVYFLDTKWLRSFEFERDWSLCWEMIRGWQMGIYASIAAVQHSEFINICVRTRAWLGTSWLKPWGATGRWLEATVQNGTLNSFPPDIWASKGLWHPNIFVPRCSKQGNLLTQPGFITGRLHPSFDISSGFISLWAQTAAPKFMPLEGLCVWEELSFQE